MVQQIQDRLQEIISLCKRHSVTSISLFGSAAKGTHHEGSDYDFLVRFSKDLNVLDYADNYFSLLETLEKLLGAKIDLVSGSSIKNPVLMEEIERTKVEVYAA